MSSFATLACEDVKFCYIGMHVRLLSTIIFLTCEDVKFNYVSGLLADSTDILPFKYCLFS